MWKDFFYYSKSERRIILLLMFIALLLLGVWVGLHWLYPPSAPVGLSDSNEIDSFLISLRGKEKKSYSQPSFAKKETAVVLQPFDPNTADSLTLSQLGLPAFIVRNILKYREKGGVFRSPESFSRIYGLQDEQFQALKPYIVIAEPVKVNTVVSDTFRQVRDTVPYIPKYPEGTVVDLNKADTSVLKRIPGIGSGLARMIVSYRQRLGGFYDVAQLQEIPHIDAGLNKWFTVTFGEIQKIQVNRASLEKLKLHPYMDFYKAKVILEYRRKRGKIKSLSQLSMFEEFTEKDLKRLAPYLSFE